MARFSGLVGYGEPTETSEGVWEDVITEVKYRGDTTRNTLRREDGEAINSDITLNASVSIVADTYARGHIHAIKYVMVAGTRWTVSSVDVQSPRLLLRLGGVYNGPTP